MDWSWCGARLLYLTSESGNDYDNWWINTTLRLQNDIRVVSYQNNKLCDTSKLKQQQIAIGAVHYAIGVLIDITHEKVQYTNLKLS